MSGDWSGIAGLIFGSSLISALVTTIGGELLKAHIDRQRTQKEDLRRAEAFRQKAAFSALYLAVAFEAYALACADVVGENSSNTSEVTGKLTNAPKLPAYPAEVDWGVLGLDEANLGMSFRTRVGLVNAVLDSGWEYDPYQVIEETTRHAGDLGLAAWHEATRLRQQHHLPPIDTSRLPWDYTELLQRHQEETRRSKVSAGDIDLE